MRHSESLVTGPRSFTQWEADPGIKPRSTWFYRLWNLPYYQHFPVKTFQVWFWVGGFDRLIPMYQSYWRSKSLLKLMELHQFSQLFLISIIFVILCGLQRKISLLLPNALCYTINQDNLQFIALVPFMLHLHLQCLEQCSKSNILVVFYGSDSVLILYISFGSLLLFLVLCRHFSSCLLIS